MTGLSPQGLLIFNSWWEQFKQTSSPVGNAHVLKAACVVGTHQS